MGLTFPESTCRWGALPSPQAPSLVGRPEEASCRVEPLNSLPFVGSVKQKPCKEECTVIFLNGVSWEVNCICQNIESHVGWLRILKSEKNRSSFPLQSRSLDPGKALEASGLGVSALDPSL